MKIKDYQIAPECQESPLYMFDEMPEGWKFTEIETTTPTLPQHLTRY